MEVTRKRDKLGREIEGDKSAGYRDCSSSEEDTGRSRMNLADYLDSFRRRPYFLQDGNLGPARRICVGIQECRGYLTADRLRSSITVTLSKTPIKLTVKNGTSTVCHSCLPAHGIC